MPKDNQAPKVDLAQLFGAVAKSLGNKREVLNQADTYNNDHGDHMVEMFEVITQAMKEKKNATPSEQLSYASQLLKQQESGSAQVYANGFASAAQQFQGKSVTTDNAGMLIQTLLGGGQALTRSGGGSSDMLGALLGGLTGQTSQGSDDGLDVGDLLNAGLAFMNAKQKGGSTADAAVDALMSASPLGQSTHRKESGAMVANTLLQVFGAMSKK